MRILALDQFGSMAGAQYCLLDAVAGFARRGWETHAMAPEGALARRLGPLCASVTEIQCGPFASGRKTFGDCLRFVSQWRGQGAALKPVVGAVDPDLIYVNGPRMLPAAVGYSAGRPVVFHAHSIVTQPAAALLTRLLVEWGDVTVIASSRFAAGAFSHGNARVVLNGVTVDPSARPRDGKVKRIVVAGRIAREKGQLAFVRAAELLKGALTDVEFEIRGGAQPLPYGRGSEDLVLLEEVRRRAADAQVTISGWIEDSREVMSGVDILAITSEPAENTPRVILEAWAAGVPVVAFAVGGIPELIEDGVTGMLVRDRTPEGLASVLLAAARQPAMLRGMAERALAHCRAKFTVDRFQRGVCDVLAEAIRRRQRSPAASTGEIAPRW